MNLDEGLQAVGEGWHPYVVSFFEMMKKLDGKPEVTEVGYRAGMLKLRAESSDPIIKELIERLQWTFERNSAVTCEYCGRRGFRRKILPFWRCLCQPCFIVEANKAADEGLI